MDSFRIVSGTPEDVQTLLNHLAEDYALIGMVTFSVVKEELIASAVLLSKGELRRAQLANGGMIQRG
jgi:hypothetical protein